MVAKAKAAGAQRYCIQDVSRKELINAILEAAEERFFVCHRSAMVMTVEGSPKPPQSES
jgi:hypothetical protein